MNPLNLDHEDIICVLQKLIDSQQWNLPKALKHMGQEDYNKLFEAMRLAGNIIEENKNASIKES
tara:strand:+ start:1944 stop:2135 length:192 start_codon:yes stop_codon:yes gene_type:complete